MTHYLSTDQLYRRILLLCSTTRQTIRAAYFVARHWPERTSNPAQMIALALVAAAHRGVDVRLLLPSYRQVLSNRRTALWFKAHLVDVRLLKAGSLHHNKLLIFDDQAAIVSTHNLTLTDFARNWNSAALITSADDVRPAITDFDIHWRLARAIKK